MMHLPKNSARIGKLKAEGVKKRAALLKLVDDCFTSTDLANAAQITKDAAKAQVAKMIQWREIVATSTYQTPRRYQKVA
jgi:hypothetical protein